MGCIVTMQTRGASAPLNAPLLMRWLTILDTPAWSTSVGGHVHQVWWSQPHPLSLRVLHRRTWQSRRPESIEILRYAQNDNLIFPPLNALQGGSSDVTRTEPFWVNPASDRWCQSSTIPRLAVRFSIGAKSAKMDNILFVEVVRVLRVSKEL